MCAVRRSIPLHGDGKAAEAVDQPGTGCEGKGRIGREREMTARKACELSNEELIKFYNAIAGEILSRVGNDTIHLQHQNQDGDPLCRSIICPKCGVKLPLITQRLADIDKIVAEKRAENSSP